MASVCADDRKSGRMPLLVLATLGVVYGDIGTSPLYALKESLHHSAQNGLTRAEVIGIVSLLLWAIMIVVTLKYVIFIMRADNKGEGGTLSLMALAQKALGRRTLALFVLGIMGASLFYGDAILTPAISILSSLEGLKLVTSAFDPYIIPLAIVIIGVLFSTNL